MTDQDLWRRNEARGPTAGPPRIAMLLRDGARHAPDAAALQAVGLDARHTPVDLGRMTEDSPLFTEADALVVEVAPGDPAELEAFDRLVNIAAGRLPLIAAVDGLTVAHTRTLLKTGAVDVLPLPFTVDELQQAVEPARRPVRPVPRAALPVRQGRIISMLGAIGGVGTTAIATQLGAMLAAQSRVCLLDFDVQFGNAALYLDARPSLTLGHLIADEARLDAELLQSVAVRHASGLDIIASPADMMPLEAVSTDFVGRTLRMAAQAYDIVIVDLPRAWTEWTLRAVERSDIACLITNLSVPAIHQTRRQLELIEANNLMEKLRIVANRVPVKMFGKVDMSETEAVLGRRIDHSISNDYPTVAAALDQGRTIADIRGGSRIVKDVKALAEMLSTVPVTEGVLLP
jgi:pilus assembly protein CpaE